MSKRKAEDDIVVEVSEKNTEGDSDAKQQSSRFKEKHSLDSDEEDNPENYEILEEDQIEGNNYTRMEYQKKLF